MDISVENVSLEYASRTGPTLALSEVTFKAAKGEFLCLVGPSGCGKTTLLNLIAGLDHPTSGTVRAAGEVVSGPGRERVVIFQEMALFPWLTAVQNVEFGLRAQVPRPQRREIARTFLNMVHLSRFENAYVHELSGGMKSRVALARALAIDPQVLLMDEPFVGLDAQTRDILHEELEEIWLKTGKTILFVTHNVREAVALGGRVLVMTCRPGRIKREFQVDLARPRSIYSESLVRYVQWIADELREEIEKVVRAEVDRDWKLKKKDVYETLRHTFGSGI